MEISFDDPEQSKIFNDKKAELTVAKTRLTKNINLTTIKFDGLKDFVVPDKPTIFEREALSHLAKRINIFMPEYMASTETLTEELETFLSGCHLD